MSTPQHLSFESAHQAWHDSLEASRTAPHGPLSVTALHWLTEHPTELPDLPGQWRADADGTVTAWFVSTDGVTHNDAALNGEVTLGPLTGFDSDTLTWGDISIDVAARGGRIAVRPRDPRSADRAAHQPTATFAPDQSWVITGAFSSKPRREVRVDAATTGLSHHYYSPGTAEFEVAGTPVSLTLFGEDDDSSLLAIFGDQTGPDLTFGPARFVTAVRDGDSVILDFNRTRNPPAAYSEHATCPFAPPENHLSVRIEAGELRPGATL